MAVIAGNNAAVKIDSSAAETVARWRIRRFKNVRPYHASNTLRGTGRKCGVTDWTGMYEAYGHTGAVFPGDEFTFIGNLGNNEGASGSAICRRLRVEWDVERGEYIKHTVWFDAGASALTLGTISPFTDTSTPDPDCSTSLTFVVHSLKTDVQRAMLDIVAKNRPYVSNSTAGHVYRKPGNIDLTWMYQAYADTSDGFPTLGDDVRLQFYVNATQFWDIMYGHVNRAPEDWGADHESMGNVSAVVAGEWNSFLATGNGWIKTPAGVTKWPF